MLSKGCNVNTEGNGGLVIISIVNGTGKQPCKEHFGSLSESGLLPFKPDVKVLF